MAIIECPECKNEISDSAESCPKCGHPNSKKKKNITKSAANHRKISVLLGVGILLIPHIFSWFTLKKGYSPLSRVVSFTWLAIALLVLVSSDSTNISKTASVNQTAAKNSDMLNVELEIAHEVKNGKLYIFGRTNLPDEMELMVDLYDSEKNLLGQDQVVISEGRFRTRAFTGHEWPDPPGEYFVKIISLMSRLQPQKVQDVIGKHGEKMEGKRIVKGDGVFEGDNFVTSVFTIDLME